MSNGDIGQFSAADSALGYFYQCRVALLFALQRLRIGEDFSVIIETLDDVVFEEKGSALELLQIKHHQKQAANLTDASPDIWKTIRIWCERINSNAFLPDTIFYLITTSNAGEESATYYLRTGPDRDIIKAKDRLLSTARTSINQTNKAAYRAFLDLEDYQRQSLLDSTFIIDLFPTIDNIEEALKNEVRLVVGRRHLDSFIYRLEGWWYRRVLQQLIAITHSDMVPILSEEIEANIDDLREQFKRESLPIDEDIIAAKVDNSVYKDSVFVKQLHLINIGANRVLAAIREYFRAFEQRSRWLREELLYVGELERYERKLVDEWGLVFERVKEDIGEEAAEETKLQAAKEVYRWVEEVIIPIRRNVTEPFVTRGSLQILSDNLRIGWHPEFMDRLHTLLEEDVVI